MNQEEAKRAFHNQRNGAKARGIAWELTFEQWLAWWGNDLPHRGTKPDDLQMCRKGDAGSYALGNIQKGTRRDNQRTAGNTARNRIAERQKREHQARLDALMWGQSADRPDPDVSDDEFELLRTTGALAHKSGPGRFAIDK